MELFRLIWTKGRLVTQLKLLLLIMMLVPSLAPGQTVADNTFKQGIKVFKQSQYSKAENLFLQAKKQGYKKPGVDYNLGVAAFKQAKYETAISHFERLKSEPELSSIACYNIGLSLERLDKKEEANRYFKLAANDDKQEKIQYLAQQKLAQQKPDKKENIQENEKEKPWETYTSITYGYDDNVKLIAEDAASGKGDSYIQSYARVRVTMPVDARVYVNFFDINYDDLDEENYRSIKAGIDYPFKFKGWKLTPAIEYSESELEDENYLNITDYRLKARKRIAQDSWTLSYRYSDIDSADEQYNHLEGERHRLRIDYRTPVEIGDLRFRYQFESNDRKDTSTRSYSPERHTIEAKLSHALQKHWTITAYGSYRYSDYPEKGGIHREDDRYRVALATEYKLNKTWFISAEYEYTDNHSNQSNEEYSRNVYQLSINGKF